MIYASTPATGSARHKGPGVYLAAGVGWGRVHEPNPILIEFRKSEGTRGEVLAFAGWLANDLDPSEPDWRGTPEQIEHARRVLSRLTRMADR